jgi:hypothetical protein
VIRGISVGLATAFFAAIVASAIHHANAIHRIEAGFQRNYEIDYVACGPMTWFDDWYYSVADRPLLHDIVWDLLPRRHLRIAKEEFQEKEFIDSRIVSAILGRADEVRIEYFERLTPEFEESFKSLNGVRKIYMHESDTSFYGEDESGKSSQRNDGSRIVSAVAAIQSLEELELLITGLDDTAVAALRGHLNLRKLGLEGCSITSAAFPIFDSLPRLRELDILATNISPAEAVTFKHRRPELIIHYDSEGYWKDHPDEHPSDDTTYDDDFFETPWQVNTNLSAR